MAASAVLRVLACIAVVAVDSLELRRVEPELEPATDKQHQKDYAKDQRPEVPKGWRFDHLGGHPYPVVASASDFDRDFVRDENGDGGEWNAQMAYDTLRAKVVKEKTEVEFAEKKMAEEKKELEEKKVKEKAAEEKSKKAEKNAAAAKAAEEAADVRVEKLTGKEDGENQTTMGGDMANVSQAVEKEMAELDKCKEQLADAKKRLKELVDIQAAKEAAAAAAANSNLSFDTSSLKDEEMTLEQKVSRARVEHEAAAANLKKQEQDVKDTLEAIAEAKTKLKAARAAPKNPVKKEKVAKEPVEKIPYVYSDEQAHRSDAAAMSAFGLATVVVTAALALA